MGALETRVAGTEAVTLTPTLPPSDTATPTASVPATRTVTPAVTETPPIVIPTVTPSRTWTPTVTPGASIAMGINPAVTRPGNRVMVTIVYRGGPAVIGLWLTSYTCCPSPDPAQWTVDGPATVTATALVNSTCPAGERDFTAWAKVDGDIVAMVKASFYVETGTPQATGTPTPQGTPQTFTMLAERWYRVTNSNAATTPEICLRFAYAPGAYVVKRAGPSQCIIRLGNPSPSGYKCFWSARCDGSCKWDGAGFCGHWWESEIWLLASETVEVSDCRLCAQADLWNPRGCAPCKVTI